MPEPHRGTTVYRKEGAGSLVDSSEQEWPLNGVFIDYLNAVQIGDEFNGGVSAGNQGDDSQKRTNLLHVGIFYLPEGLE